MHNQVSIRQTRMYLLDAVNAQHCACWWLGEFVRTMAGSNSHSQRVHSSFLHKSFRFVRIGQKLIVSEFTHRTMSVFLFATS